MGIHYIPIIRVFDVSNLDIPKKVAASRRTDGKLWWKYANTIPVQQHEFSKIKIMNNAMTNKMEAYKFSQCLFNLLLYNNLQLDIPQKFTFTTENDMSTFIYFLDEDEVVVIPIMPNHHQLLKFTLYESKYPILKLQTNPK